MTHALNELIYGGSYDINNPEYVGQLGAEIRNTADEIRTQEVGPEVARDMARAVDVLMKTEASSFQKLYPIMEAAAVTGDPQLLGTAGDVLNLTYPVDDTVDPLVKDINERSQREFRMALNRTSRTRDFGRALVSSEALHDRRINNDFDMTIQLSNWLAREQRGTLGAEDQQDLNELRELLRRSEERQKLEAQGVENDNQFDDAVKVNMADLLADDDDDLDGNRAA